MTTGLPLPFPLSLLVEKMDQDVLFLETGENMLWGGVCVCPLNRRSICQALGMDDTVLLEMHLTQSWYNVVLVSLHYWELIPSTKIYCCILCTQHHANPFITWRLRINGGRTGVKESPNLTPHATRNATLLQCRSPRILLILLSCHLFTF